MIRRVALLSTALASLALPAAADEQTVKLIQLLIQKGILSPNQAHDLLRETSGHGRRAAASAPDEAAPATPPGQIRVTYVPQFIRKQIADQVRAEVMTEAQSEGWAAPDALPEWTKRIKLYGDLRFRYQGDMFDDGNDNGFLNFSALNSGTPYDFLNRFNNGSAPPPFLNTTEDRNRFRVRARFGVDAQIDDWVTADIRVGTGQDNFISPNQTLGTPGDFGKYQLWLDRAYFKLTPLKELTVYAGRFNNPFLPSDLMFYSDLGFDGVAAVYSQNIASGLNLFGTAGAFPLENTAFDFSTNSQTKFGSRDAYLAGIQGGARWKIAPEYQAILGIGLFDFLGVQGAVSAPCFVQASTSSTFYCNTDNTRPPFLQFGNTLFPIRDIQAVTGVNNPPDPQYFGLASKFNVLDIHPRFEISTYAPVNIALEGEFIKNLSFNRNEILHHGPPSQSDVGGNGAFVGYPVNNRGSIPLGSPAGTVGPYQGGDTGYMAKVTVGNLEIKKPWDWSASVAYRYLESDSTLDAITDTDFHLGGTNAKGYVLTGSVGVAHNTLVQLRWFSATQIAGPPYGVNTLQLDLLSSF